MTDITSVGVGPFADLGLFNTQVCKAGNILSVQLGSLEYQPLFGIDLKYFLSEEFRFQNESFKSYLVEVLANNQINVSSVVDVLEKLYATYTFNIVPDEINGSLIAR